MTVLLDKTLRFHREDSKTNVCIPFLVERDYFSLEFVCSYTPKNCGDESLAERLIDEGLKIYVPEKHREQYEPRRQFLPSVVNLITLSIDCNEEYIGCAHRHHAEQRHIISAAFSSPGFFRYSPKAGNWRAVINVHAVVSDEVCYHLRILAHSGDVPEEKLSGGGAA